MCKAPIISTYGLVVAMAMSDEHGVAGRVLLDRIYAIVLTGFLFAVAGFTRDRACFDHLNLLPGIARTPALAWLVAVLYVLGYCWIAAAYALTVRETGKILPRLNQARAFWGGSWPRVLLMLAVLLIEYIPPSVIRAIAATLRICASN